MHFGLKCRTFHFCQKICFLTKSNVLTSNITISFFVFYPKILKQGLLGPKVTVFCFAWNFQFQKIWQCWFQKWQYSFKIPAQNYSTKVRLIANLIFFFFFQKTFWIVKLEGVDLKNDSDFWKFESWNIPKIAKYGISRPTLKIVESNFLRTSSVYLHLSLI